MKLTFFQSGGGDCILVAGEDGHHMLADGDMAGTYTEHVSPTLNALQQAGQELDIVYVSHIDADHISGVLRMLDDLVDWRVFNFRQRKGLNPKPPKSLQPPNVKKIWHNAFHDTIDKNSGPIEEMLAATATILQGSELQEVLEKADLQQNISTGVRQALQLSNRISDGQLGLELNPEYEGALMLVKEGMPMSIPLGGMTIFVLGPFEADLKKLREEWNDWLTKNKGVLKDLARDAKIDEENLRENGAALITEPAIAQADALGRRDLVTPPNLASLMLLIEEGGKTVLLTGDGHSDEILNGLKHHRKLNTQGRLHVDVLKVQHHGAGFNINEDFCNRVTANNYVFCSNGAHENPDLQVLDLLVKSRQQPGDRKPFKFWFNSSSGSVFKASDSKENGRVLHMRKVEERMKTLANASGGRLTFKFLEDRSFEIDLGLEPIPDQ